MKKIFPAVTITSFILFASFILSDDPVEHINKALNTFFEKYPQEKVYLQFDKQHYIIGDTIWYKAYVTYKTAPSSISKILYVEFIDENGKIFKRQTLPVDESGAYGDFILDEELPASIYYIRSYTAWMMNFDPAFYFYNKISIGFDEMPDDHRELSDTTDRIIKFFPEGGDMVEGLTSLIAFKATDQNGFPQNIKGKIINNTGKQIAELKTIHDGLGSFIIHPVPGNQYSAIIELGNGKTEKIDLPEIKKSGVVFHTETVSSTKGDSVYFRISRSIKNKDLYEHLIICAEMQGVSDFTYINFDSTTAGNYNNTIVTAPSPLAIDQFFPGILHLSVFNGSGDILAERLVFLHSKQQIPGIELRSTQLNFATHAKNTFTLNMPEYANGSYSVSVTDADMEKGNTNDQNIVSNLLLTSDIINCVKDPGWYFQNNDKNVTDLLMLTSEWSRFKWKDILNNKFPQLKYYAESSLMLKGRAYQVKNKNIQPLYEGDIPIMIKDQNGSLINIFSVPVDSLGYFNIAGLNIQDSVTIYFKDTEKKKKNEEGGYTVQLEKRPVDSIRFVTIPGSEINSVYHYFSNNNRSKDTISGNSLNVLRRERNILAPVTIKAKIKTHVDSVVANYATNIFNNKTAKTLDFTNDPTTQNLFGIDVIHYLVGKVPGLVYKYDKNQLPLIYWRLTDGLFNREIDPLVRIKMNSPAFFLNEQLLNEGSEGYDEAINLLLNVKMAEVALIRIFSPGTMPLVSGDAPHGAFVIYTKNGSENQLTPFVNTFDKIKIAGYTSVNKFLSADYESKKNLVVPDTRKTLYWNPELKMDPVSHSAFFSFFNNDITKRFHIVVEGIDSTGKIVRIDKIFQ